jgi:hypothetical protein
VRPSPTRGATPPDAAGWKPAFQGGRLPSAAAAALLLASLAFTAATARVQPEAPPEPAPAPERATAENEALPGEVTPALDESVTRGLAALARLQEDDGGFSGGRYGKSVAVTALACLAFMADGNTPGRGEYGDVVERGLESILASANETGLLATESANGPMYGHGFATLFLGEIYGMTPGGADTDLAARTHEALVKAVRLIERSQSEEGGWRYNPVPHDADISVTICQIMALRSARNAGIEVNKDTIDRAVEYVRQCQNPDGGFRYQTTAGQSNWSRTAAGVSSLFYAGIYEDDSIERGLAYLHASAAPNDARPLPYYFYGHYYAVQAMYLAGGEHWATWWPSVRKELLEQQRPDGTWADPTVGDTYGTAMALIVLQMPKRYLPIFQK